MFTVSSSLLFLLYPLESDVLFCFLFFSEQTQKVKGEKLDKRPWYSNILATIHSGNVQLKLSGKHVYFTINSPKGAAKRTKNKNVHYASSVQQSSFCATSGQLLPAPHTELDVDVHLFYVVFVLCQHSTALKKNLRWSGCCSVIGHFGYPSRMFWNSIGCYPRALSFLFLPVWLWEAGRVSCSSLYTRPFIQLQGRKTELLETHVSLPLCCKSAAAWIHG